MTKNVRMMLAIVSFSCGGYFHVEAAEAEHVCDGLPHLALCSGESDGLDWHRSVHLPTPSAEAAHVPSQECTVLAQTGGSTCAAFCQDYGFQCVRGQDNALGHPSSCTLDSAAGGSGGNGCFESLEDQVCTCEVSENAAPPPPPPVAPSCRSDICTDVADDCCAPGGEARGCREEGYYEMPGGSSSYTPCLSDYGADAIYQCCQDNLLQDDNSHLPCAQPGGVPVPFAAHSRSDTPARPLLAKLSAGSQGVRLRRWQVTSDLEATIIDDRSDLALVLADYHMTTEVMTEYFESPTNVCDQCITELDAVFEAAVSGEYFFVVAADDDFRLWFGDTEEDAMDAGPIVSVTGWTSPRQWNKYGDQSRSSRVQLHSGSSYFIRARVREWGGGDNLAVAMAAAGATISDGTLPLQVNDAAVGLLYIPISLHLQRSSTTDFLQGQLQPVPFLSVERFSEDFVAPTNWEYMAFVSDRPGNLTFSHGENAGAVAQVALVGTGSIYTARVNAHLVANSESPLGNADAPLGHSFSLDQFVLTGSARLEESASDHTVLQLTSSDLGYQGQAFYRLGSPDLTAGFELQFDMYTGDGLNGGADGQCVSLGNNDLAGRLEEDGVPQGIAICFDEYPNQLDDGSGDAGISILFDGAIVWEHRATVLPRQPVLDPSNSCDDGDCDVVSDQRPVTIFADATWHRVRVSVETSGRVGLDLDHGIYQAVADIDEFVLRFVHTRAYDLHLGFTGRTQPPPLGNRHLVRKVSMDFGVDVDAVVTPGPAGLLIHSTVPVSGILRAWETRDELLLVGDAGHTDSTLVVVVEAPPWDEFSWNHASEEVAGRQGEWTIVLAPGGVDSTGMNCVEPDTDATLVLSGLSNETFIVRTRSCDNEDCAVVSYERPTTQSSIGHGGDAARGVDGDTNGVYSSSTCTHTADSSPWWQVDLGSSTLIDHVDIYHRTDCCQDRAVGARIVVSDSSDFATGSLCDVLREAGGAPERVQCRGLKGRYVTVDLTATETERILTLCEVRVYELGSPLHIGPEHVALVTLYSPSRVDGSAAVQRIRATCSREWTLVSATFREVDRSSCAEVGMSWCRHSESCIPRVQSLCAHGTIVSVVNGNTISRNGVPLCTLDAGDAWSGRVLSGDVFTGTAAMHGSVLRDMLVFNYSSPRATAGTEVRVPPVTLGMLSSRLSGTSFVLSDLGASARVYVSCLSKQGACRVRLARPVSDDIATGMDWTSSAGGKPQTTSCPGLGDIIGGHGILGGGGDWVQVTFDLSDQPHSLANVHLIFYKLDSWDNERASVSVDGIEVWGATFSVQDGANNKCGAGFNDLLRPVSVTVPHSASTLALRVTTTLDQAANDEAWGISDVVVSTDSTYTKVKSVGDIAAVVPPGIGAVAIPLGDHSGTMRVLSDALVTVGISVTDSDLMPVPPATSDWLYGIPSPMLVGSANAAFDYWHTDMSQYDEASCKQAQIDGPSGNDCCGQIGIHLECPEGMTIASGHIEGTCCSKVCPAGDTSCSCDSCDTGDDEHWSSGLLCVTSGCLTTGLGSSSAVTSFGYVEEESSSGGRGHFQPLDSLLWSRSGYASEGRGHASRVRFMHRCVAGGFETIPYMYEDPSCGVIKALSFVWWALHWCSYQWGCRQPRWQDDCHQCNDDHWRANRHAIPQWRQVNCICVSVVLQIVFGALLRTSRCGKDGWGVAHIVMGSLTAVSLPCIFCTKCSVGARQEQQQAEQAAFVAQAAMAANAAQREGGAARASGSLARNDSIPLQRKLQPAADPEVMAARMEKPVSPIDVQLMNKFSRIECATCNGTGMLKPGSITVAQLRGDPSIAYLSSTVPPTIESIDARSPLRFQLSPGDVVLRVAYRIREDDGDESSGDTLVRSRTAGEPFDCTAMDGRQLNAALRARTSSASLCEEAAEADEQVLVILPASVHGMGSRQMPAVSCLVCAGHGTVDQYVGSFAAPQEPDEHPCEVCYGDSKYGVSTECLHFYCEDCIRGSLEAILDQGQFPCVIPKPPRTRFIVSERTRTPLASVSLRSRCEACLPPGSTCRAYCPACRVESHGVHDEPAKGRIEGPALTFLESKGVVTLDFQYRFMRQQDGSTAEKFFKCPNPGCKHYLIDQDPQYAVVPRGSTEVEGFVRKMRLGKCECGARVCVRCHAMAEPDVRRAIEKLADVTKDNLEDLEKEGGVSHWKTLQMDDVADMLGIKHGDLVQVERCPGSHSSGEVVARTYSGNVLPPSTKPIVPTQSLPVGEYMVRKVANVRESKELSSFKVRGIDGKPINLKAGSTVTVLEVYGNRVRHALGWSSAVGHRSGDTIMEPVASTGRLKGTIAEVTSTQFVVQWDEATRGLLAEQPQLLREPAAVEGEWTESVGRVDLPDLWIVIKDGYTHECPTELNRELSTDPATLKLMESIGKHCPNCGAFIQKNDGCNIMMCGTTAHGRLADALAHGGCGHLFHWDSLKPAKTFYIGLDGQRVDNYIGGVATDGGGAMP